MIAQQDRHDYPDKPRCVVSPNDLEPIGVWMPTSTRTLEVGLAATERSLKELTADRSLRMSILAGFREALLRRRRLLVARVVQEVGKLPHEAAAEFDYAIAFLDYAINLLEGSSQSGASGSIGRILTVPVGVAHLICPYNDPVAGLTRKIAPAIAAGCPVVIQPSPRAMLCAELVEEALAEADPIGASTWLKCDLPALAEFVMAHRAVNVVSFTGSTSTGRAVAEVAGRNFVRCILELGGNNWFTVFADADIDKAVDDLVARKIKAAGQACSSVNRIAVEADIYANFRSRLQQRIADLLVGPAGTPGAAMGPVRGLEDVVRLQKLVEAGQSNGERLIHQAPPGQGIPGPDTCMPLLVLETLTGDKSVLDEQEAFGPVMGLTRIDDLDAHFERVRNNQQPLVSYLYGARTSFLESIAPTLRHGSVGINTTGIQGPHLPTGGFGASGLGREGGVEGLREFETTINLRVGE